MTFTLWFFFVIAPLLALAVAALGARQFMVAAEREAAAEKRRLGKFKNTLYDKPRDSSYSQGVLVPQLLDLESNRLYNYKSSEDFQLALEQLTRDAQELTRNTEKTQKVWKQVASGTSIAAAIFGILATALATVFSAH